MAVLPGGGSAENILSDELEARRVASEDWGMVRVARAGSQQRSRGCLEMVKSHFLAGRSLTAKHPVFRLIYELKSVTGPRRGRSLAPNGLGSPDERLAPAHQKNFHQRI